MPKWIDNDTISLIFLGTIAVIGIINNNENITLSAIGALSGYLGAMGLQSIKKD